MSSLGTVIAIMLSGFITGALARFAVPGPDPMPAWLTVSIGLAGSAVGLGVDTATNGHHAAIASFCAFAAAVLLVVAYRLIVQKRPIWGPEAFRFPRRGIGIQAARERLRRAGVDPDAMLNRALEERRRREQEDEHREHPDDEPPSSEPERRDE